DLSLRLFLAWEFFESGWEKWNGENWFGDIQSAFPFPFDRLPAAFNWELSLWAELLGALFLLLGLGTRLTALVLIVGAALLLWSRPAAQAKLEALDLDDGGHATLAEPGE
ncbi:DoxX family membrane protein, partial [Vibrio vulnificus]